MTEKTFLENREKQLAVVCSIGIVSRFGDRIKMRYPKLVADHPEISLESAYQVSKIIDDLEYHVSLKIVWETIKNDLPLLYSQLQKILVNLTTSGYGIDDFEAMTQEKFACGQGVIEILSDSDDIILLDTFKRAQLLSAGMPFLIVQECRIRPSDALKQHSQAIREIILSKGATNPRVFGSVVYGTDTSDSDLDILIDPDPGPRRPWGSDGGIKAELLDLLGVKIDILTPDGLPAEIRDAVLNEAAAIQSMPPGTPKLF
jgi:hypothetical protein